MPHSKNSFFIFAFSFLISAFLSPSAEAVELYPESSLTPASVESVLSQTLHEEKIVFFAETHKGSASFEKVGNRFLEVLRNKGFDCLLLENGKRDFQSAFTAFIKGESYERSVGVSRTHLYKLLGLNIEEDIEEKALFEEARKLHYQIFAIDHDLSLKQLNLLNDFNFEQDSAKFLEIEMGRNVFMASEIAGHLNSGACQKVITVLGASHINPEALATYSSRVLKSVPELMNLSKCKSVSYRLRSNSSSEEKNLQVYKAIFGD